MGTKALRMIGLTRKSRGEDEGTHADQRRRIEAVCEREGFKLLRVDREHKVSGAKAWREREIGRAIQCVHDGRADGIVVATEDRITRERLEAAIEIWTAMEEAEVVFVTDDGVDTRRGDDAEFSFHLNAILARKQWKAYRLRSGLGKQRALAEGIHTSRTPLGYRRSGEPTRLGGKGSKLVPDPVLGPAVTSLFERYSWGASLRACADALEEETGRHISPSTVAGIVRSKTYLGIAWSSEHVETPDAHPALVSRGTWARVQARLSSNPQPEHNGSVAGRGILGGGLARCAGCGQPMHVNAYGSNGERRTAYYCRTPACPSPASATTASLDGLVLPGIIELLRAPDRADVVREHGAASDAALEAERALTDFEERALKLAMAQIDAAKIAAERDRFIEERDAAWLRFEGANQRLGDLENTPTTEEEFENLDPARKRKLAAAVIEEVRLKKSTKRGRHAEPVAERAAVAWR